MATGWLQVFGKAGDEPSSASPHVSPPLTGLPGFCIQAPIFSVGKKSLKTLFLYR